MTSTRPGAAAGIRAAGAADRDAVAELLHAAFRDDPVSVWIFPDPVHRESAHRRLFGAFLDTGLAHGTVQMTADGAGAAVWYHVRDGELVGEEHLVRGVGAADPGNARLPELGRRTGQVHPLDRDHVYLQAIAVSPQRQCAGLGGALLRPMLDHCDRTGLAAYLEASSARSRALYERHGFALLDETVELPDGPPMWPMWRDPSA